MKKKLTVVALFAVLTATGCTSSPEDTGLSLDEKVGSKSVPTFNEMQGTPEGWTSTLTAEIPAEEKAEAEEYFKFQPPALRNGADTCTYSREPANMPSYMLNRGEDFLSKAFIYQLSESDGSLPQKEISSIPVETSAGKLEFAYTTYEPKVTDIKKNTDKEADPLKAEATQVYRAVAVRVFDGLIDQERIAGNPAPGPFGSDSTKTLPGVVLTYECNTKEAFNEEEAKSLFAATRVEIKK